MGNYPGVHPVCEGVWGLGKTGEGVCVWWGGVRRGGLQGGAPGAGNYQGVQDWWRVNRVNILRDSWMTIFAEDNKGSVWIHTGEIHWGEKAASKRVKGF
jgi:hypothetical protein